MSLSHHLILLHIRVDYEYFLNAKNFASVSYVTGVSRVYITIDSAALETRRIQDYGTKMREGSLVELCPALYTLTIFSP